MKSFKKTLLPLLLCLLMALSLTAGAQSAAPASDELNAYVDSLGFLSDSERETLRAAYTEIDALLSRLDELPPEGDNKEAEDILARLNALYSSISDLETTVAENMDGAEPLPAAVAEEPDQAWVDEQTTENDAMNPNCPCFYNNEEEDDYVFDYEAASQVSEEDLRVMDAYRSLEALDEVIQLMQDQPEVQQALKDRYEDILNSLPGLMDETDAD